MIVRPRWGWFGGGLLSVLVDDGNAVKLLYLQPPDITQNVLDKERIPQQEKTTSITCSTFYFIFESREEQTRAIFLTCFFCIWYLLYLTTYLHKVSLITIVHDSTHAVNILLYKQQYSPTSVKLLFNCCCGNMRLLVHSITQFYPRKLY